MNDAIEAWPKSPVMIADKGAVFAIDPDAAVTDGALIGVKLASARSVVRRAGVKLRKGQCLFGLVWCRVRIELP